MRKRAGNNRIAVKKTCGEHRFTGEKGRRKLQKKGEGGKRVQKGELPNTQHSMNHLLKEKREKGGKKGAIDLDFDIEVKIRETKAGWGFQGLTAERLLWKADKERKKKATMAKGKIKSSGGGGLDST